jgi:peptidoglycan/LPS O-acetylase OafA/YrhL
VADLSAARAVRPEPFVPRPSAGSGESRLIALDGLRGVAALGVLLIHIGYVGGNPGIAPAAALSVDLFFMLSGFVIGHGFEPKLLGGAMRWRTFMAYRAARFFPGLAIGVVLAAAVEICLGRGSAELGRQFVLHLLLLPDPASPVLFPLNGVLWTLFFEFVANAGHAAAVRRLSTPLLAALVLGCGCAWAWTAGQTGNWGGGWNWATVAGGFARVGWAYGIGLLLYRLSASGRIRVPVVPAFLPVGAAAVLLIAPTFDLGAARVVVPLFVLLPLILLLGASASITAPGRRAASWVGELSYPLYTMHPPLLLICAALLGADGGLPILWAIAGCLIVLAAAGVAHFAEAPMRNRLKDLVTERKAQPA